jgi:hypothetical protein
MPESVESAGFKRPVCRTPKSDLSSTTKYGQIVTVMNLVTLKASDKRELLFNKHASKYNINFIIIDIMI